MRGSSSSARGGQFDRDLEVKCRGHPLERRERAAVRETAADVMNDGPDFTQWTNESMIEMVNVLCGTQLAPSDFVS